MNSLYFLLCASTHRLAAILTVMGLTFNGSMLQAQTLTQSVSEVRESKQMDESANPIQEASKVYTFEGDGKPADTGRTGGASRGNCPYLASQPELKPLLLTALMPKTNLALTLSDRPTFWFYIPYTMAQYDRAIFVLEDSEKNPILHPPLTVEVELSDIPGIIGVLLPPDAQPLELDREYHWYFWLECSPIEPSKNLRVDGWVKRVSPDSETENGKVMNLVTPEELAELLVQLEQAQTPKERFVAYATHHIWLDALTEIAQDRLADNPLWTDRDKDWSDLLRSVNCEPLSYTDVYCADEDSLMTDD